MKQEETLALLDALRDRGVRRVELDESGSVRAVEFGDVSTGQLADPEDPTKEPNGDPLFAAHEAAILQVQQGRFRRPTKASA